MNMGIMVLVAEAIPVYPEADEKIILPAVVLASIIASLGAMLRMDAERNAARAEGVSAAVMKIDKMYREATDDNVLLTERLSLAEAATRNCRPKLKDAVAERPRIKKRSPVSTVPLPGYGH